jgi:hypothetical protein
MLRHPRRRPAFYERVSELLRNDDVLTPSCVLAACQRAQDEFLTSPPIDVDELRPAPALRSPYQRRAR